ncbi:MAG TPA: hypothetical protein DDW62_12225, partial [Marinilabiliaceae bacterium]|nr:hypothetical protein [Marinilabiliaceae bacterium]
SGAVIELRENSLQGPILSKIKVPSGDTWQAVEAGVKNIKSEIIDLVFVLKKGSQLEIDWVQFE